MALAPVCLVLGAGAGIGGNVAHRFAQEGFHAALCRRSDDAGLTAAVERLRSNGHAASGHLLNAVAPGAIEDLVSSVEAEYGPINVAVYNLGAQIGNRQLSDTTPKTFELGWRLSTFGLFRLAQTLLPRMAAGGGGTLLVTSATASVRGNKGQHSHAAAMGGRRMLCQTLHAEFAPKGVHVAHIIIDGAVDAPDTLGRVLGEERFQALRTHKGLDKDGLVLPQEIAETYWHLASQHRSAWTHELDLRPFSEQAWWND